MNKLTRIEMAMALIAGGSFAVVAEEWRPVVIALCLAILSSWFIPWRYSVTTRQQRRRFSMIGVPFLLLALFRMASSRSTVDTSLGIALLGTVYVFLGAVIELYRRAPEARAEIFHSGVIMVMMVAGITYKARSYPYALLAYAVLAVAMLRRPYPGMTLEQAPPLSRAPRLGIILAAMVALLLGGMMVKTLPPLARQASMIYFQGMVADLMPESHLFGASSDLSSLTKMGGSRAVAARVYGPQTRLRGQVFVTYHRGQWSAPVSKELRSEHKAQDGWITLPGTPLSNPTRWTIAPVKPVSGPVPLPTGAYRVGGIADLELDSFDGLLGDAIDPYQVEASGDPGERSPKRAALQSQAWKDLYLALPPHLQADLLAWSQPLAGQGGAQSRARRLEAYLADHGTYNPKARRAPDKDPVLAFLAGGMAGHCELFASTLALSLRAQGIPTRYVIGYQMGERNPFGGYFIVRDRDAHAWVEVYTEKGWEAFDPTPPAQYQATHPEDGPSLLEGLLDGAKAIISNMLSWMRGLTLPGWMIAGGLLAVLLWIVVRHPGALMALLRRSPGPVGEALLLAQVQARLAGIGLQRQPQETVLEFSQRISQELNEQTAAPYCRWLEGYAALRFGGAGAAAELQRVAASLPNPRRRDRPRA